MSLPKAIWRGLAATCLTTTLFTTTTHASNSDDASAIPYGSVSSTNSQEGNPAYNAVDGNASSRWSSNQLGTELSMEFIAPHDVSHVDIEFFRSSEREANFRLELQDEEGQWHIVYDGQSIPSINAAGTYHINLVSNVIAAKLIGHGNTANNWTAVEEIVWYGKQSNTESDNPAITGSPFESEVFVKGLQAWRKPDGLFEGAACANCHSPDAFDLAYFDFSRDDIIRRTAPHLPNQSDQEAIADLVEFIRGHYGIVAPKDPRTFRPFQPGSGEVLAGENRYLRDEAFGAQFKDGGYRFANVAVLSVEEALKQKDEWQNINIRDVDFGIAFPLWSRDGFHGEQEVSHLEWLPSLPRLPKSEYVTDWYALQDAYIESPTEDNFYAYYDKIDSNYFLLHGVENNSVDQRVFTEQSHDGVSTQGANQRFKSVQFASHLFRQEHLLQGEDRNTRPVFGLYRNGNNEIRSQGSLGNPMWSVGDHYRVHNDRAFDFPTQAPFPPVLNDTFHSHSDESEMNKLAWFTLGWTFDPALARSCCGNPGANGEYFLHTLSRAKEIGALDAQYDNISYPLHAQFIFTKTVISKSYDDYAVKCSRFGCPEQNPFDIAVTNFTSYQKHIRNTPTAHQEQRQMYIFNTLNSLRMMLYLAEHHIDSGDKSIGSKLRKTDNRGVMFEMKHFIDFVADSENPHKSHDLALWQRVADKLKKL